LPPSLCTREFERILLIKPSALGDVIHTVPLLAKLRARYPRAQIDWLLTPQNAELLRCHPALSNVVLFDRHGFARFGRSWRATTGLIQLLRFGDRYARPASLGTVRNRQRGSRAHWISRSRGTNPW